MSWAWRSFLSRPHPLLLSSLRPARRHGGEQLTAVLGSKTRSRGYAFNSNGDLHDGVTRQEATAKRHLYVVLDDHEDGYGVHKLDLGDQEDHLDGGARRLPEPPVFRVELTTLRERVQFAAVGSSIVATGTTLRSPLLDGRFIPGDIGGVLIYNTKTGGLAVTPHLPTGLVPGYKAAMAVGNTLYMLSSEPPYHYDYHNCGGSLHCLTADLDPDDDTDWFWRWELLSGTSPWLWSSFMHPPRLPFMADHVTAHVAHTSPRCSGHHKILVSLRPTKKNPLGATYYFSTVTRRWRRCGEWHMPIVGHVHYDGELDAWVGLHGVDDENMDGPRVTDGRLCIGNNTSAQSKWKVGKEKLFLLDEDGAAGWRHVDAKLVPMVSREGGSEYCLMERMCPEGKEEEEEDCWGDGGKCLLRLTLFRLKRGKDGEPVATAHRLAHSYEVSRHNRHFDAQAFWM